MNDQLPSLNNLLKQLQQVPYLASKNLHRVAHYFLEMDVQRLANFCTIIQTAHNRLKKCDRCCAWQEKDGVCLFCNSSKRDTSLICLVETWYDLQAIEKTGGFKGVYHVLGGALSPLDGITPENLSLNQLIARLDSGCVELIFALNQTPEGEATSSYIARKIYLAYPDRSFKITCLSRGVPVGSSLESVDRVTVVKALTERRLF